MKGFSLLEVLVSIAIITILVAGIFMISDVANMSWDSITAQLDLQQQARQAMEGMSRELRQSRPLDITITEAGAKLTFLVPFSAQPISYYRENNQIIREHPAGAKTALANNITALLFTSSNSIVEIQLSASKIIKQKILTFPLREKVRLRNE